MDTNTNNTEVTLSPFDTIKQEVMQKISTMTQDEIAGYIANLKVNAEESRKSNTVIRGKLQNAIDTITNFIQDNYDSSWQDKLKELAEELDIELTKNITVTFTVTYEADITVPLDFNNDDIDETDFDVSITYSGHNSDVEFDNDSTDISDFEVENA